MYPRDDATFVIFKKERYEKGREKNTVIKIR